MQTVLLPFKVKKEILATGADMKGRFCFARGRRAFLSQEFGDLGEADNYRHYRDAIKKAQRAGGFKPRIVACDLHPGYFSTKFAQDYAIRLPAEGGRTPARRRRANACPPKVGVRSIQHHHAHIASCMVDNHIDGEIIGVSFDGTGYGSDGNMWGGEFLRGGYRGFERIAHLDYSAMPGGDQAVREPWRMAVSFLYKTYKQKYGEVAIPFVKRLDKRKSGILVQMIDQNINAPLSSSIGRLFDGVSSLAGLRDTVDYEAQAAIELEETADRGCSGTYPYRIQRGTIRTEPMIRSIVGDLENGEKKGVIAAKFHNTVAAIIREVINAAAKRHGIKTIVLSGGVFQNKLLVARTRTLLEKTDRSVYFHNNFSTTDTSIALGQIAIANNH